MSASAEQIHDAIQQAQTHPQSAEEVLTILELLNDRITREVNELQKRIRDAAAGVQP